VSEFHHADEEIRSVMRELSEGRHEFKSNLAHEFLQGFSQGDAHPAKRAGDDLFITCFCLNPDNDDVWEEHADHHRGFVLEFRVIDDRRPRAGCGMVSSRVLGRAPAERCESNVRKRLPGRDEGRQCIDGG
jgi:hypothetical protein